MILGCPSVDGRRSAAQSGAGASTSGAPEARRRPFGPNEDRSPLSQFVGQHSKRIANTARSENAARKARKKDRKTICGRCRKEKLEGTRLRTCSRCKSINYCSADCQREHWQDGHKDECASFIHPPFAKTFDPTDRADAPWPLHPIFASSNENGLGIWMTTAGDLTSMLQQASIPPDVRAADVPPEGSPSFRRWAGLGGPNCRDLGEEMRKYAGPTVATLRVLVQNRRTDGRVIAVVGGETVVSVSSIMKDNLLPEEQSRVRFQPLEESSPIDRMDLMLVPPWVDYDNRLRVAIAEINGTIPPKGNFRSDGQYQAPARPTGSPWDRVVNWERAQIVLAPGDFAVYLVQYRIGDGHLYNSYPEIMTRATGVCVPCYLTRAKGTDSGWCASAAGEFRLARNVPMLPSDLFTPMATMDFAYVEEYYKPFFDEGPDVFAVKRFGKRAEQMNSLLSTLGPLQMQAMMSVLPPDQREEIKRRSKAMGFDMDRMMRGQ
ncbi:hypothetical protein GGF50DRAFT_64918 [Schizophyllum commune]